MVVLVVSIGFFLGFGFAARFGEFKRLFIAKGVPGVYPKTSIYAMIPIGLFFLYLSLASFLWGDTWIDDNPVAIAGMIGMGGLIVISLVWQPHWLKPVWLRWMEDNYGHVLEEMFAEARQIGGVNWERQVKTQADLEQWADSVAQKHGWQRLQ